MRAVDSIAARRASLKRSLAKVYVAKSYQDFEGDTNGEKLGTADCSLWAVGGQLWFDSPVNRAKNTGRHDLLQDSIVGVAHG